MKVGDVIINPFFNKRNYGTDVSIEPQYKTMVVKITEKNTTVLTYKGHIKEFNTEVCKYWNVSHHIDIEEMILGSDAYEQEWMTHE